MTLLKRIAEALFILLLFFGNNVSYAQGMLDPVSFEVIKAPEKVQPKEKFEIVIEAEIEGQWYLYSINNDPDAGPYPTKFTSVNPDLEIISEIQESEPVIKMDPNFNAELGSHTKEATFTIPLSFKDAKSINTDISLEVHYQVCDDKACLPPKTKTITYSMAVAGQEGTASFQNEGTKPLVTERDGNGSGSVQSETKNISTSGVGGKGILSFLWIAITAGFAALLTPCVFPMIPLTVSFFSKKSESKGTQGLGAALIFGFAIVATFTILGALLALIIGASGANQFAANPWVNLFIGLTLLVFAFSLLGAFEIRLPHQLTNWLNRRSNESGGVVGVLFMSLTISAVSFSCTAPFVGGVLAATAGGEWFYPILGMIGFSAAFASPFVLFALFPGWLESLPKSGSWMNVVKVLLGFIELAAAVKFISNADLVWEWGLVSRPFAIAAWIAIFLLAALYVLGTFALKHEQKPNQIGTGRLMLSLPFFLFSFYLIPGLMGASLGIWDAWLPPKQATDVSVVYSIAQTSGGGSESKENEFEMWSEDYESSLAAAKENNQPVFIDFTGYTCTNCRAMEANVFPLTDVQRHFDKMELVRLYTDDGTQGPEYQKFQFQLTGTIALPTYVIMDPDTGQVLQQISGYTDDQTFTEFLEKGIQAYGKSRS